MESMLTQGRTPEPHMEKTPPGPLSVPGPAGVQDPLSKDGCWASSRGQGVSLRLDRGPGIQEGHSLWVALVRPSLSLDSAKATGLSWETERRVWGRGYS